jgi:hypothetical protein
MGVRPGPDLCYSYIYIYIYCAIYIVLYIYIYCAKHIYASSVDSTPPRLPQQVHTERWRESCRNGPRASDSPHRPPLRLRAYVYTCIDILLCSDRLAIDRASAARTCCAPGALSAAPGAASASPSFDSSVTFVLEASTGPQATGTAGAGGAEGASDGLGSTMTLVGSVLTCNGSGDGRGRSHAPAAMRQRLVAGTKTRARAP